MGIKKVKLLFKCILKRYYKKIHFSQLYGKKVSIDIMIYIYKYAAERTIIEGIYLLCSLFKKYNICPIFVFDGKLPEQKKEELKRRREKEKDQKLNTKKL